MRIRRFQVDSSVKEYVLEQISAESGGFSAIAKLALRNLDLSKGHSFIILPDYLEPDRLSEFRFESSEVIDRSCSISLMAKIVKSFISNPRARVLLQDYYRNRSDPGWDHDEYKSWIVTHNDEIYWGLHGADLQEDELEGLISGASYWPFCAFFSLSSAFEPKTALADADLEEIVGGLVGIAVDAFDADSFVIWWREDLCPFPMSPIS
jgi:hypothetical protein